MSSNLRVYEQQSWTHASLTETSLILSFTLNGLSLFLTGASKWAFLRVQLNSS